MNPEPKNRWIIVTPTVCQGDVPAYWDEDNKPVTYATAREAWKEIADTQIMKLQEFEPEDYVIDCCIYPDGVIATETHGVFFDPAKINEYR